MELFTVKRYKRDVPKHFEKNESEIYQKLLHKLKKRKTRVGSENVPQEKLIKSPKKAIIETKKCTSNISIETVAKEALTNEFSVIGENKDILKKTEATKVLFNWLIHPTIISTKLSRFENDISTNDLNAIKYLTSNTREALKNIGVTNLFPVQSTVIPWLLDAHSKGAPFRPRDICVSSPTGSGKTLAYAIPIVQLLSKRVKCEIRALIVLPVVELALQVFRIFKALCKNTAVKVCLLSKQLPFALEQDKLIKFYNGQFHAQADIVVTTPGRLVAHLHTTNGINLSLLKFLVIDEADRIIDAAFQNWFYHLSQCFSPSADQQLNNFVCFNELLHNSGSEPHKLLFSATLSHDPEKLKQMQLFQPKLFTSVTYTPNISNGIEKETELNTPIEKFEFVGKYVIPAELTEKYCITESRLKPLTLYSLIKDNNWKKFVCFTNNAESAMRLSFVLTKLIGNSLQISELSSSLDARTRSNIMSKFSRGTIHGLICSDALARGVDFPNVDIVISYDPPRHIKTYIHRIGRTARAGKEGVAVTLLTLAESNHFNDLLTEVGKSVTEEIIVSTKIEEENAQIYSNSLKELRKKIEKNKRMKVLMKERIKDMSNIAEKPLSEPTIMEKLQQRASLKANEIIINKK